MKILDKNNTKDIIGIDVGMHSIKAVELSKLQNNTKLVAYSEHIHNSVDGLSPKKLYNNISTLLDNPILGEFHSKKINISFPRNVSQNHFAIFDDNSKFVKESINKFIISKLNLDINNHYFYYHPIIGDKKSKVYMIEVIDRDYFDRFNAYIKSGGLEILSINSANALQLSNLIDESRSNTLLIDIGHSTTKMLFCHNTNCIEKRFDYGGETLSNTISRELGLSNKKSIELQKNVGIHGSKLADRISLLVKDELDTLILSIQNFVDECLDVFRINNNSKFQIYLTGSLASMPGFSEYLKSNLNNPTSIINPWEKISLYPLKPIPKYRLPKYAGAIALAS
jgi:cell division ATPase FtsA